MSNNIQSVFLLIVLWLPIMAQTHNQCIETYQELVKSVTSKVVNIDNLTDGFYPPNRQTTTVADVYYYIQMGNASTEFKYKFRWSSSSILNLIRPELLRDLSLFLYHHWEIAEIHILIDPICSDVKLTLGDIFADWENICNDRTCTVDSVVLLNKLTTHVSCK